MSQIKVRKNRLGLTSKDASFNDQKDAAGDLSSSRVAMTFQQVKDTSQETGLQEWFQSWLAAVTAAGMQAAAGYKGIVKKGINISGARSVLGDFNPKKIGDKEEALKAGLLPIEPIKTGGFRWVSDQTTYSLDNNFVFNSLQANYIADLITLDLIDTFDRLVVGKSVAQISAPAASSILESKMSDYRILRWITPSDDAPLGFKNPKVKLRGGVLLISVEIKLAGLIYFVPISLTISEVEQTAG